MSSRQEDPRSHFLEEVSVGDALAADPIRPAPAEVPQAGPRPGTFVDWRTIDPATIRGENIPVEELRYYREILDEMLPSREGQYVVIVGRAVDSYHPNLETAAKHAEECLRDRIFLIKKVVRFEPVFSSGVIG